MTDDNGRTRTFTWEDPRAAAAQALTQPGLEFLRAMIAGEHPRPPFTSAFDMALVEVQEGVTVFELEPAEWMYNPIGVVHGGVAATALDSAMTCAVFSTLPAGVGATTSDLQVRYLRPITSDTGLVRAEGRIVHVGKRSATAEGRLVVAADGTLLAHGTSGLAILR